MKLRLGLVLLSLVLTSCTNVRKESPLPPPRQIVEEVRAEVPKRIIFFIGDGMGVPYVTAGAYAKAAPLAMMSMPLFSLLRNHEYEHVDTDSAASATAFATGHKTHFEGVSVHPGTLTSEELNPAYHYETLLEAAQKHGLRTGMVTTSRINHATPAAFAAHRSDRRSYEGIAEQLSTSGVDVLMGSGSKYFEKRKDGKNLFSEMEQDGYLIARTPDQLTQETKKVVALYHEGDMPFIGKEKRARSLSDMVSDALEILDRDNTKGFVLMVEGSFIDWCGHSLDAECAVRETLDFDEAIGRGLEYARERDDTLVLATADHETGGLTVIDPHYSERFSRVLGGEKALAKSLELPAGSGGSAPPPLVHLKLGGPGQNQPAKLPKTDAGWGMTEIDDPRFTLTWGHLSLASRPLWMSSDRFYAAHTVAMVPLFAEGPGASFISTSRDNAALGRALLALINTPQTAHFQKPFEDGNKPKNVILMIGDGMGVNPLTFATYLHGELAMTQMPVQGLVSTHGTNVIVNDSAATATALSTGQRTRKKVIGMVVKEGKLVEGRTIIEAAEARGIQTGIVSTTQLTHATPAAFFAHVDQRKKRQDIAQNFMGFRSRIPESDGIEVVITGGHADFDGAAQSELQKQGYEVRTSWNPAGSEKNLLMFMSEQGLESATKRRQNEGPKLADMTESALKQLTKSEAPFFLMVEGGQIDWALHNVDRTTRIADEVQDFDEAVAAAVEFARDRGDTLVIVTADHDHTMSLLGNHYPFQSGRCGFEARCGGKFEAIEHPVTVTGVPETEGFTDKKLRQDAPPPSLVVQYAWMVQEGALLADLDAPHTAHLVPLFAIGPWATRLAGYHDQPEIGQLLHAWTND